MDLADALEVARQIDYLAGYPTVKVKDAKYSQDSRRKIVIGLKQEQVIIKHSRERISQAERSGLRLTMIIDKLGTSQYKNP